MEKINEKEVKERIEEIAIEKTFALSEIMMAGFDRILGEFRKQFKAFLDAMPQSFVEYLANIKEE